MAQGLDEYGDVPGKGGTQYAELDTVLPDADLHHQGTIPGPGGSLTFWMTTPRPESVSYEMWERHTKMRWDKAFAKE